MQTRNPFLDEFAKLGEQAIGLAQAAGDEARSVMRAQGERMAAELDLVRRDEMDAALAALRVELRAEFNARLAAFSSRAATQPDISARPADEAG